MLNKHHILWYIKKGISYMNKVYDYFNQYGELMNEPQCKEEMEDQKDCVLGDVEPTDDELLEIESMVDSMGHDGPDGTF